MSIKNLIIFGTRPEAIKMAPLIKAFRANSKFETRVCVTAQHREMLDQVLDFFEIEPDYDLNLMKKNQNLYNLTADIVSRLKEPLEDFNPDYVFVHGDTTTTMGSSIAAFYNGAKVCHIEAGLRTFNKQSPFPEEMNRCVTGTIADYHLCPTETSKNNLLKEGVEESAILVTGNTVIDALNYSTTKLKFYEDKELQKLKSTLNLDQKIILVTGHRRENHGEGFLQICNALKELAEKYKNFDIVYPVHLNPNVQKPVYNALGNIDNIILIPPLSYPSFVWLMNQSYLIITDSGGVQEEAPTLGKPVLVMRDTTERPEAVKAGTVKLVGANQETIVGVASELIENRELYNKMSALHNPYGDGKACERIVKHIENI